MVVLNDRVEERSEDFVRLGIGGIHAHTGVQVVDSGTDAIVQRRAQLGLLGLQLVDHVLQIWYNHDLYLEQTTGYKLQSVNGTLQTTVLSTATHLGEMLLQQRLALGSLGAVQLLVGVLDLAHRVRVHLRRLGQHDGLE